MAIASSKFNKLVVSAQTFIFEPCVVRWWWLKMQLLIMLMLNRLCSLGVMAPPGRIWLHPSTVARLIWLSYLEAVPSPARRRCHENSCASSCLRAPAGIWTSSLDQASSFSSLYQLFEHGCCRCHRDGHGSSGQTSWMSHVTEGHEGGLLLVTANLKQWDREDRAHRFRAGWSYLLFFLSMLSSLTFKTQ